MVLRRPWARGSKTTNYRRLLIRLCKICRKADGPGHNRRIDRDGLVEEVEDEVWNLYRFATEHYLLLSTERIPEVGSSISIHPIGSGTSRDEVVDSSESFLTLEQAAIRMQELADDQGLEPSVGVAAVGLSEALLQENLIYNHSSTEARRQMARDAVSRIVIRVDRGTVIVRKGDVVTEQQARTIAALQEKVTRGNQWGTTFAFMAFSALLLGVLYQFGRGFIRIFSTRPRDLAAVGVILLLVVAMARADMEISVSLSTLMGLGTERSTFWYMVPFAGGAMLVRILVNSETSLLWILAASALCGLVMEQQVLYTIFFLVSGLAGSTALAHGAARMDVLKAGVMAGLINAALALLINLVRAHMADLGPAAATQPMWDVLAAFSGGLLSGFLVLALLPLFELAGFVTDYKLLELANLNHPLLRQLMLKAPGTYHHSVTVAQLCEAAAESVGANALQTRVACYFHDIGKALQPHYFIENQRGGVNPHDNLAPKTSARIITAHMVDGAAIARQYNLPPPILDGITQHHGTGLIQYFYAKALEQAAPGEEINEADFRYPGELPNSKETGIMMLADRVEAACRTLPENGDEDIRAMIQKLVNGAIMDGQLERCPLTIKELYTIVDSFADTLLGIYHHRIEYPGLPPRNQDGGATQNEQATGPIITLEMANPLREGGTLHRLAGDDER